MRSLKINAMDHIVLNVASIERSLAFYSGILGLNGERLEEFKSGAVGFPSVRINESTLIDLTLKDDLEPDQTRRNLNHFCLVAEATDLQHLAQVLATQGVVVTQGPVSRWGARGQATSIYVLDPDGNEVEIRCY